MEQMVQTPSSDMITSQWISELIKTKKEKIFTEEEEFPILHWICMKDKRELFTSLASIQTIKKKEKRAFFQRLHNQRTAYELCLLSSSLPFIDMFLRVDVFDILHGEEGRESAFDLTLQWFCHLYPPSNHSIMDKDSYDPLLIADSEHSLALSTTPLPPLSGFHLILRKFKAIMLHVLHSGKREHFDYLLDYYSNAIVKAMRSRCYSALSLLFSLVPITTHMTGKQRSQIINEYKGDLPTLLLLLRHQFDFFTENHVDYSPLQNFAARGYHHSLLLLHRHFLSLSPPTSLPSNFPLHWQFGEKGGENKYNNQGDRESSEQERDWSRKLFATTAGGMTALHFAALSNRPGTLQYLLSFPSARAVTSLPNAEGMTPLDCAAMKGRTAAYDLLHRLI